MECPHCQSPTRVLESRHVDDGAAIRRRRECGACGHRLTTFERPASEPLFVRKRDGTRQRFDRTKLRAALLRSTHKRQLSADDVEALVERVQLAVAADGGELTAARIGELCLQGLLDLDYGAYLQFLGTLPSADAETARAASVGSVRAGGQHASFPAKPGS